MAQKVLMTSRTIRISEITELLAKHDLEIVVIPRSGAEPHKPDAEEIEKYWRDADAFVMSGRDLVTREALAAATNLRVGVSPVIGTENIDVRAATEFGIAIGYGAVPENFIGVAEAVVMLAAALIKRLPAKWGALRDGGYRVDDAGHMVMNSTIGLTGLGNVGQATARRLQGWDATLIATDPYVDSRVAESLGVKLVDLDTLLQTADVVSIMVPLLDETRKLLGEREIGLMKPGAYLINTSRGDCVDEAALTRALEAGRLAGAAIDVWEQEPAPATNPLRFMPNVIATGHNVGHSQEVYAALAPAAAENLIRGLRGEPPLHFRNPGVVPSWRQRLERLGVVPLPAIEGR